MAKLPPPPVGKDASDETLDLLSLALYLRENHKDELEAAGVAGRAEGDYRARASARLYDFAARYFTDQIENIRREAVIAYLANERRRGPRFLRLAAAAAVGLLITHAAIALWHDPAPLASLASGGARMVQDLAGSRP
jgi:hypothetical protein